MLLDLFLQLRELDSSPGKSNVLRKSNSLTVKVIERHGDLGPRLDFDTRREGHVG